MMLAMVAAIVVPYLYSELRSKPHELNRTTMNAKNFLRFAVYAVLGFALSSFWRRSM